MGNFLAKFAAWELAKSKGAYHITRMAWPQVLLGLAASLSVAPLRPGRDCVCTKWRPRL